MAIYDAPIGRGWLQLADLTEREREEHLLETYVDLAKLPADERIGRMKAMITEVYSLPDGKLFSFTKSKLRAWTRMESEAARTIAASYDAAMAEMPGDVAWRRVSIIRAVAKELSTEEQRAIRALVPQMLPEEVGVGYASSTTSRSEQPAATTNRPWWAFWKRH